MKKPNSIKISGIIGIGAFLGIVLFLILNINAPIILTQETIPTNAGTKIVTIASCKSVPPIQGNTACLLSNNIVNNTSTSSTDTAKLSLQCTNGGIPVNNVCPTSIVQITTLPQNIKPQSIKPNETIQIQPLVTITDNTGAVHSTNPSGISLVLQSLIGITQLQSFIKTPLSFVTQAGGPIDPIDKGTLNLIIQVHALPNESINANGTLFTTLNGDQLNPSGVFWTARGTTDNAGNINATFQTPNGLQRSYVFNISSYVTQIQSKTISSPLIFSLSDILVQNGKDMSYKNNGTQVLFKTGLNYDQNIAIQNSQGNYIVVLPSDDTINYCGKNSVADAYKSEVSTPSSGWVNTILYTYNLAPALGIMTITQANGVVTTLDHSGLESYGDGYEDGNYCLTASNIPRNSTLQITGSGSFAPDPRTIITPSTQQTYTYTCNAALGAANIIEQYSLPSTSATCSWNQ